MAEYDIQGPSRVCAATGRELKPGARFHGLLIEEDGRLVRRDFPTDAWTGPPEGHIAHLVGRVPTDDKPRRPAIDENLLLDCFDRLKGSRETDSVNFRYVATLLLMRKKKFKFEDAARDELGRDVLLVRDSRGGALHHVEGPKLSDGQIATGPNEVFRVLGWV